LRRDWDRVARLKGKDDSAGWRKNLAAGVSFITLSLSIEDKERKGKGEAEIALNFSISDPQSPTRIFRIESVTRPLFPCNSANRAILLRQGFVSMQFSFR